MVFVYNQREEVVVMSVVETWAGDWGGKLKVG